MCLRLCFFDAYSLVSLCVYICIEVYTCETNKTKVLEEI